MKSLCHTVLFAAVAGLAARPAPAAPPTVDRIFPPGGRRGTTVSVKITGKLDAGTKAWCSRKRVKLALDSKSRTLKLAIPKDTQPGVCWLRLYNAQGPSPPRAFVIGTLPEVIEKEPNDRLKQSQPLKSSAVANGVLSKRGDVDTFAVSLKKGQTLVASLTANNVLGSPMDGVLQVVSTRGFVLQQNDDVHGFDPQLAFAAPKDGTFHVRVFAFPATPNSSIRLSGASNYVYRLTLATGPFLDHPYPLAVSQGSERTVELHGWNIPADLKSLVVPAAALRSVVPIRDGRLANTSRVRLVSHPAVAEREPNPPARPQLVQLPVTVSGHIDEPRDVDAFQFAAKKGDQLRFRVEARSLGSPLDPVLRLLDAKGTAVAQAETRSSTAIDETLSYRVPADGQYRLEVGDLHRRGGWQFFYRLAMGPPPKLESLRVAADRFALVTGKPLVIPVTVAGSGDPTAAATFEVRGLPKGVSVKTAVAARSGKSSSRRSRSRRRRGRRSSRSRGRTVQITLTGKSLPAFSGPIRIVAVERGGTPLEHLAASAVAGTGERTTHLWLTISGPAAR